MSARQSFDLATSASFAVSSASAFPVGLFVPHVLTTLRSKVLRAHD